MEPCLLLNIVFGNRGEIGDARLAGQQVVTGGLDNLLVEIEADREQAAVAVQEELEIHFIDEGTALVCDVLEIVDEAHDMRARVGQEGEKLGVKRVGFARRAGGGSTEACGRGYR